MNEAGHRCRMSGRDHAAQAHPIGQRRAMRVNIGESRHRLMPFVQGIEADADMHAVLRGPVEQFLVTLESAGQRFAVQSPGQGIVEGQLLGTRFRTNDDVVDVVGRGRIDVANEKHPVEALDPEHVKQVVHQLGFARTVHELHVVELATHVLPRRLVSLANVSAIVKTRNPVGPVARPRVTVERIVETALAILDEEDTEALTTTNLARRLGISQPTLYSHVASLDEVRRAVAWRGMSELSERVRRAVLGRTGDDALFAMAHAYRAYVRTHPARYLVQLAAPATPEYLAASERAAEAVRAVLRSYDLSDAQVVEAHVAFRAAVHGFVHLEAHHALGLHQRGRKPDRSFDFFVTLFAAGLRQLPR